MNKDAQILNEKTNTLVDDFAEIHYSEIDVLSAMEQQAVEFAEWMSKAIESNYQSNGNWFVNGKGIVTTKQLYNKFNQQTNGNKQTI